VNRPEFGLYSVACLRKSSGTSDVHGARSEASSDRSTHNVWLQPAQNSHYFVYIRSGRSLTETRCHRRGYLHERREWVTFSIAPEQRRDRLDSSGTTFQAHIPREVERRTRPITTGQRARDNDGPYFGGWMRCSMSIVPGACLPPGPGRNETSFASSFSPHVVQMICGSHRWLW
jgi:hypothetical protein